jgi:ribonuclease HII
VVGAAILSKPIPGLKDSKQISGKQRRELAAVIQERASGIGLGWVWPAEIDDMGLTQATTLAMNRALECVQSQYDEIIIDGKFNFLSNNPKCRAVIRADNTVPSVSAASIIAKVARDEYMHNISKKFPAYGFDRHVGYGTKLHLDSLRVHGPCKQHRLSFKPIRAVA